MSLDAVVYCDCFEMGRLRTPHPLDWNVYIDETGARARQCNSDSVEEALEFDRWDDTACDHPGGVLLHQYLGHIANISVIRDHLMRHAQDKFPIILSQVVQNGSHCCDWIPTLQVQHLKPELQALTNVRGDNPVREQIIRHFEEQLTELVDAALRVSKPITF